MSILKTFCFPALLLVCCFISLSAQSQNKELKFNAYSGLFSFRGSGATSNAPISITGPSDEPGLFTAYPFGRKGGFSAAFEIQAQRVTKGKQLLGTGIGFERLQSKVAFDSVATQIGRLQSKGNVVLTNSFITVTPYFGQRFNVRNILLDITAGLDIAFSTNVYGTAKVRFDKEYSYSHRYSNYPVDFRPRLQVQAAYKQIGITAGYSVGTQNLYNSSGIDYLQNEAYADFLRLGISYKLR